MSSDEKKAKKNWMELGSGYMFMFAKGREAIGVKVDVTGGTVDPGDTSRLRSISDTIVKNGLPQLEVGPGELVPLTKAEYHSDQYHHPVDDIVDQAQEAGLMKS